MQGKLIYSPSYKIYELDLATRKQHQLIELNSSSHSISVIDDLLLLIGTDADASSKIQEFDTSRLTFRTVTEGYRPMYMQAHHKFFYFAGDLYLIELNGPVQSPRKVAEGEFSYAHAIPVSDDEVVFPIVSDAGHTPPYRYNLVTDKLERLPFNRQCTSYVWRSASKQLLCGIDGTYEYYLIGLDGQQSVPVDLSGLPNKAPVPLLYIPKYDVLILNVARVAWVDSRPDERFDLWAYSFKDKHSELLVEGTAPGRGAIVWVEKGP